MSTFILAGLVGFEPTIFCTKNKCITVMLQPIANNWRVCEGSYQRRVIPAPPFLTNDKHMPAYLHRVILFTVKRYSFIFICLTNGILVGRHPTGPWRKIRDSNPRKSCLFVGLVNRCFRPLSQSSLFFVNSEP